MPKRRPLIAKKRPVQPLRGMAHGLVNVISATMARAAGETKARSPDNRNAEPGTLVNGFSSCGK